MDAELRARAEALKLVCFDVDGVLTDGRLLLGDNSVEYKAFHSRDGLGLKLLMDAGLEVGVITGRRSLVVADRMDSLGVTHVHQGASDKVPVFEALLAELELEAAEAAYVGDDVVDLPVMRRAGLACTVADAHPLVAGYAHWRAPSGGGRGGAREICEWILEARGQLDSVLARYLRDTAVSRTVDRGSR